MAGIVSRINQGRYDTEQELLNLRKNASKIVRTDVIDAVNQRLRRHHPKLYQRIVGPLRLRERDEKYQCYCNNPKSLHVIYLDIVSGNVHKDSLLCDACWQEDLAKTWGYYGWASKLIPQVMWDCLCEKRAYEKFVE